MKIDPNIQYKKVKDCEPGELIRIRNGADLAIMISVEENRPIIGVLLPSVKTFVVPTSTYCVSFGKEWIIEQVVGPETYPQNTQFNETIGALLLTESELTLCFGPAAGAWEERSYVCLSTFAFKGSPGQHVAPILSWRLWASEAARDGGEKPAFEFSPPEQIPTN